ncbi:MAG: mannosyl-3-phosphoglycerate phosphatase [Gammaproteobacteria bacterium HGW-Gammaproteobacteria-3]|nr:MAG: mannosyl-3-phosphoglycerate phosphatase [Gammaproteobacteria bacterium HGW-Gammaproteobacteria-3]
MSNKVKIRARQREINSLISKKYANETQASDRLIFTDLDGSLLNHENYSFTDALPALRMISDQAIPLIINSSKTKAEILAIRKKLHNLHPFIAENGAAIFVPKNYFRGFRQALNCIMLGPARKQLLSVLTDLRRHHGFAFSCFADRGSAQIAQLTGLMPEQAEKANERMGSELLTWQGNASDLTEFKNLLAMKGLRLVKGGRFWHVMGQAGKAIAMAWLQAQFQAKRPADYERKISFETRF